MGVEGNDPPAWSTHRNWQPDGVGFYRTPPVFLKPGDVMETGVKDIGLLRNRMVSPAG
ncbi:MAG: fumarylacetoacetate hydrolase family protein [Candidatus Dormibacteraeota bacterium]|nr:fumarylacetoacetate hydrolase family protein [Candidatus Dormibacteraeota bacterium]